MHQPCMASEAFTCRGFDNEQTTKCLEQLLVDGGVWILLRVREFVNAPERVPLRNPNIE